MSSFASRLRELRKLKSLRQKDLADALGLAQTTIANYEQNARFPDESVLHSVADYFDVTLDYLLGRTDRMTSLSELEAEEKAAEGVGGPALSPLAREFLDTLLSEDKDSQQRASRLILGTVSGGMKVGRIYTEVLEPALKEVGRLWSLSRIDVAQEHYFSTATQIIMSQLYTFMETPQSRGLSAVAIATCGELHEIGVRMVSDFLRMDGWDSVFLGTNLCNRELLNALRHHGADMAAVSVTMDYHIDALANTIQMIRSDEEYREVKILVGGSAFIGKDGLWRSLGADGFARSAEEAVQVASGLFAAPSRGSVATNEEQRS
jgi:methanogenic corrinoid protein MtbC1